MTFRTGTTVLAPPEGLLRFAGVLHTERERDAAAAGREHVLGRDIHLPLGELRRHPRERAGLVSDTHFDRLPLRRAESRLLQRATRLRRVLVLDHETDGALATTGRSRCAPEIHATIRERLRRGRERARSVPQLHDEFSRHVRPPPSLSCALLPILDACVKAVG